MTDPETRRRELVDELAEIDRRYRRALGEEYDAVHGAGVHLPIEVIDDEFHRLDGRETAVLDELRALAREFQRDDRTVLVPSARRCGPHGPYFGFRRTWVPAPVD